MTASHRARKTAYLLTGATGFLGREVLARLLSRGDSVLVTTRRRDRESLQDAGARIASVLEMVAPGAGGHDLSVAFADVTAPDLALSPEGHTWISGVDRLHIIHGAAEVRFDLAWEAMHLQNVVGTRHVLALAERLSREGRLVRFDHVSTAFIAGDRDGLALETETDVGQRPRNAYERSKLEAEIEVKRSLDRGIPITVHRPSIIVGDSRTGRASTFKVLYWPLKVYARGRFRTVFGRPDCTIDIVPVDYVAAAIVELLSTNEALGETFHLAAGPERQSTISEVVEIAERVFARGEVRYVDPDVYVKYVRPFVRPLLKVIRPEVAEKGGVYLPYLRSNPSFSVERASRLLAARGLEPPHVLRYLERILNYAKATDFGRARDQVSGVSS